MTVSFHVDGDPKPMPKKQAFARIVNGKPFARVYDAKTADGWKSLIADAVKPFRPAAPIEGPVHVELTFLIRRPQALCRRKDPGGPIEHATHGRFDCENLTKAVFDTLTQIGFWRDDGQVSDLHVRKFYAGKLGRPGMDVVITWDDGATAVGLFNEVARA